VLHWPIANETTAAMSRMICRGRGFVLLET
jgi:hypothetical protein